MAYQYTYYRCTGNRGERDLPRFCEEVVSDRLGEPLKGLQVPSEVAAQVVAMLREDRSRAEEQQVKLAMDGRASTENSDRAMDAQRAFELANEAYSPYISQDSAEKSKLLRMLFLDCFLAP